MRRLLVAFLATFCLGGSCTPPHVNFPETDGGPVEVPELDAVDSCGAHSVGSLAMCVEQGRIEQDVRVIAKPRPPDSNHHASVRNLCADRLVEHGYQVERHQYGSGINVVGVKPGFSKPEEHVVVAAHYDHLDACAGADDNASGVAVLLENARVLSSARFDRSLVVACFDEAERGQLGSKAFVERIKARGDKVIVAMNYEAVGYSSEEPESQKTPENFEQYFPDQALELVDSDYRGNFLTVVAEPSTTEWAKIIVDRGKVSQLPVQVLRLSALQKQKTQDKLHVSDHVSFWKSNIPALLFTDSGSFRNPHFHCRKSADSPDTLSYDFAGRVAQATLGAVVTALELR